MRQERGDRRRLRSAIQLTVLDLRRSEERLVRMLGSDDPRGFGELPRGAWTEYRSLFALSLPPATVNVVAGTYNLLIEWNEIVWSAYAARPPDIFHASDQNRLAPAEMYDPLSTQISDARSRLEHELDLHSP
jgi:hypothetical protein